MQHFLMFPQKQFCIYLSFSHIFQFIFPAGSPHAAAEALLMLLNLPEKPLLDPYVEELLKTNTTAEAMELVALLSSPKRNVFVHLCMFLREGIERRYYNAMHVGKLNLPHTAQQTTFFVVVGNFSKLQHDNIYWLCHFFPFKRKYLVVFY